MIFKLNNVGIVEEANIRLEGITVLASKNGYGKTTVEKALFGLLSSNSDFVKKRKRWLVSKINDSLRNELFFSKRNHKGSIPSFFNTISILSEKISELIEKKNEITLQDLESLFKDNGDNTNSLLEVDLNKIKAVLSGIITQFRTMPIIVIKSILNELFEGQIYSFGKEKDLIIEIDGLIGGDTILEIKKQSLNFQPNYSTSIMPVFFPTPERLSYSVNKTINYLNDEHFLYDINDLFSLRPEPVNDIPNRNDVLDFISSSINGKAHYDNSKGKLFFIDNRFPENEIEFCNVASGIKIFSYISVLVSTGVIRENTILIIDEPESSLHPEWQRVFANLVKILHDKLGVTTLISTHSLYMLRAFDVLRRDDKTISFYQLRKRENGFTFTEDVSEDLESVYSDLYTPLEIIDNE